MRKRYSEQEKRAVVRRWQQSGKSAWAFARENDVSYQTISVWITRFGSTELASAGASPRAPEQTEPVQFVRVEQAPRVGRMAVEIGPARIIVERGFDPELLGALVVALKGQV